MTFRFSASFVPLIFRGAAPHACLRADGVTSTSPRPTTTSFCGTGGRVANVPSSLRAPNAIATSSSGDGSCLLQAFSRSAGTPTRVGVPPTLVRPTTMTSASRSMLFAVFRAGMLVLTGPA